MFSLMQDIRPLHGRCLLRNFIWECLRLFPVAPTLEHRASMKRFVSLQLLNPETVGTIPWIGDQPVARPLPMYRRTQTKNKSTDIPVSSEIRTHDPSVRAGEDNSCSRLRVHCERIWKYGFHKLPNLIENHWNRFRESSHFGF
jgi:hypothetical protein